MIRFRWILSFSFVVVLNSCLDEINLELKEVRQILIVDAQLTEGNGPHLITIKNSGAFTNNIAGAQEPISNALVTLVKDGSESVILDEESPGIYKTSGIMGIPGSSYQLFIDYNGNNYQSTVETMRSSTPIDSLGFNLNSALINNTSGNLIDQDIITLKVSSSFPQSTKDHFVRYRIFGSYEFQEIGTQGNLNPKTCFVREIIDLDNVSIVNSADLQDNKLRNEDILDKIVDFKFRFKYCFTVVQQSLTKTEYNFWKLVKDEFERKGDIFESPPANVRGNVHNVDPTKQDIIGLFSVVSESTLSIIVTSAEAGNPTPQCRPFPRPPEQCTNCLILPKSSLIRPDCFK